MAVDIDEQLQKAEARVKRLKQRKLLSEAKSEAKKAVAENFELQRELKQVKDSNNWLRGAIKNAIEDFRKQTSVINGGKENEWNGINITTVVNRLNDILMGQQPSQKK